MKSQCVFLLRFSSPWAGCRRNALSGGNSGSFLRHRGWSRGVCPGGAVGAEALWGADAVKQRGECAAFKALADCPGIKPQASKCPGPREWMAAGSICPLPQGCGWAGNRTCSPKEPLSQAAPAVSSLSRHGTPFKVGVSHVLPHEPLCRGTALLHVAPSQLRL